MRNALYFCLKLSGIYTNNINVIKSDNCLLQNDKLCGKIKSK